MNPTKGSRTTRKAAPRRTTSGRQRKDGPPAAPAPRPLAMKSTSKVLAALAIAVGKPAPEPTPVPVRLESTRGRYIVDWLIHELAATLCDVAEVPSAANRLRRAPRCAIVPDGYGAVMSALKSAAHGFATVRGVHQSAVDTSEWQWTWGDAEPLVNALSIEAVLEALRAAIGTVASTRFSGALRFLGSYSTLPDAEITRLKASLVDLYDLLAELDIEELPATEA